MEREAEAVRSTSGAFERVIKDLLETRNEVQQHQGQGSDFSGPVQICVVELSALLTSCQSIMREWQTYCPKATTLASSMPLNLPMPSSPSPSK